MAEFSGGEALSSGFRLIRERPLAVLSWGVVYLVLGVLPQFAMFGLLGPEFLSLAGPREGADPELAMQQFAALNTKLALLQPIQIISSVAAAAVLYSAVFRAVLEPQESRFGYVRFGAQELWVGVVLVISIVLLAIVLVMMMLPLIFATALSSMGGGNAGMSAGAGLMLFVGVFAILGLMAWLLARFSLAYPMSFAERKFRLFEAWTLTKGHAMKIIGVFVAVFVVIIVVELVLAALVFLVIVPAATGGRDLAAALQSLGPDWMITALPWIFLFSAVMSLFAGLGYAVMLAPLANIYRQLTVGAAPATTP